MEFFCTGLSDLTELYFDIAVNPPYNDDPIDSFFICLILELFDTPKLPYMQGDFIIKHLEDVRSQRKDDLAIGE
jgi:hypothetical protein